jgi:membrane-associated protein
MTEQILALSLSWGLPFLGLIIGLSCLGLPLPVSLLMIFSGSFVASGDLSLWLVFGTSFLSAVAGDQLGYFIGRRSGRPLLRWLSGKTDGRLLRRAETYTRTRGGGGVFFSRWLVSPLGPYVNLIAGATDMGWRKFSLYDAAGEGIWVGLYIGLGVMFGRNVQAVADIVANASGFLVAGLIMLLLGKYLLHVSKHPGRADKDGSPGPAP